LITCERVSERVCNPIAGLRQVHFAIKVRKIAKGSEIMIYFKINIEIGTG